MGLRIIKNKKMFGQKKIKNGTKSKIQINITVEKSVIWNVEFLSMSMYSIDNSNQNYLCRQKWTNVNIGSE